MFHPALWKLTQLKWRGEFRRFLHSLRTIRGLFQLAFIILIFGFVGFQMYFAPKLGAASRPFAGHLQSMIDDFLPLGLVTFTCYIVLFSTGEGTVYFTPSEVAFLFPAPITRRQLLSYKLVASLLGISLISLAFTVSSMPPIHLFLPRYIAILSTFAFIQLLAMNVAFARQVIQKRIHILIRILLGLIVTIVVLVALGQSLHSVANGNWSDYFNAFKASMAGRLILAPFHVFARAILATDWTSFRLDGSILISVDLVLLVLAYKMDALSLEAAFALSEKMTARLKRMRSKGIWQGLITTKSDAARRRIPQLPYWAGIGPILWQRMSTIVRSSPKLLLIPFGAIAVASFVVYEMTSSNSGEQIAPFMGIGILGYVSFLISLSMQHDIEHVGYLKSLPISSRSIVIGDLIGFPIMLSIIQSLFLVGEACFFSNFASWFLLGACLTPLLNFLLFGIDKLVFYVYPTRMAKGAPGDFQASGKQMIFMTLKILILGCAVAFVALIAAPITIFFQSPLVAFVSTGTVLAIECVVLVPLLAYAFDRFDPGSTQVA